MLEFIAIVAIGVCGAKVLEKINNEAENNEIEKERLRKSKKNIWESDVPPRTEKERLEQENRRLEYQMAILNAKNIKNSKKNNLPWNKI